MEKNTWNKNNTRTLINIKHAESSTVKFIKATNNPKKMKIFWDEVAVEMNSSFTGIECKIKYNALLSKYKSELDNSKKSGANKSSWIYWELFNSTFSKKDNVFLNDVIELGGDEKEFEDELILLESKDFNYSTIRKTKETGSESTNKKKRKSDLGQIKIEVLELWKEKLIEEKENDRKTNNKMRMK